MRLAACAAVVLLAGGCTSRPPTVDSATVSGRVQDAGGGPVVGASVRAGTGSAVLTGADGSFTLTGVVLPYDLVVEFSSGGVTYLTAVPGVHAAAPVVTAAGAEASPPPSTDQLVGVSGRLSRSYGQVVGDEHRVDVYGTGLVSTCPTSGCAFDAAAGSYRVGAAWRGTQPRSAVLRAIEWRPVPGSAEVQDYLGYAERTLTLQPGTDLASQDLSMVAVSKSTASGQVIVPATATLTFRAVRIVWDAQFPQWEIANSDSTGGPPVPGAFSYALPAIPSARAWMRAEASDASGGSLVIDRLLPVAGGGGITAEARLPVLQEPAEVAVNVPATPTFRWDGIGAGAVYALTYGHATRRVTVYTTATQWKVPAGDDRFALATSGAHHWEVTALTPCASADDVLTEASCNLRHDQLMSSASSRTFPRAFTPASSF